MITCLVDFALVNRGTKSW